MSESKRYESAPIEIFHGEAMREFHKGAEYKSNEINVNGTRYINGVEFNRLIASFKMKIVKEYGISQDAIEILEVEK